MLAGSKTLAIILGASTWKEHYPELDSSPSFERSATYFRNYLCSSRGLSLPPMNVCDLFDQELHPGAMISSIKKFVRDRVTTNPEISDVIFYFVGHGGYLQKDEYFLAMKCTSKEAKEATAFKISYLRDIVLDVAIEKRVLIILDACYSGASMTVFGSMAVEDGETVKLLQETLSPEILVRGVVLFCAAGAQKWAKTPIDGEFTMFSGALLHVLESGRAEGERYLSLRESAELVNTHIVQSFGSDGVLSQIHVPYQDLRDIANDPYFPNSAYPITDVNDRVDILYSEIEKINAKLQHLGGSSGSAGMPAAKPDVGGEGARWLFDVIARAEAEPDGLRQLALAGLQRLLGGKTVRQEVIEYVIDNLLYKMCREGGILCERQISSVLLKKSKFPGHFQWEENKNLVLYCPTGEGEHKVFGDTSFLISESQVDQAISQTRFKVNVGRNTIFEFAKWWEKHKPSRIHPGDKFMDDEAMATYDGQFFMFKYERKIRLTKIKSEVDIYEQSFLTEHDRFYALTVARPTLGLQFSMQLVDLEGWAVEAPTLAATYYHVADTDAPTSEVIHPWSVKARAPGLVLPGLALLVQWAPKAVSA